MTSSQMQLARLVADAAPFASSDARARLENCLIDFLAAVLAGARTPLGRSVAGKYAADGAKGYAFTLSYLAEISEFSHGHNRSAGHVGSTVLPATLALAVEHRAGQSASETLTTGALAGYEAFSRVGTALMPALEDWGSNQTGFAGSLGACAAAAHANGLDATATCSALGIAAYLTPLSPTEGYNSGANSAEAAMATHTGMVAAELASLGVSGSPRLLDDLHERIVGKPAAPAYAPPWPDGDLGIDHVYFKPFPCCRFTHGAVEGILAVLAAGTVATELSDVHVFVTPRAYQTCGALPVDAPVHYRERQFSIRYLTALAIVAGRVTAQEVLAAPSAVDAAAIAVASDVHLYVRPELAAAGNICPTVLEVRLRNGTVLDQSVLSPWGCPSAPMTRPHLMDKFEQVATGILSSSEADMWKDLSTKLAWRELSERIRTHLTAAA